MGQDLVWPSLVTTKTPFESKINDSHSPPLQYEIVHENQKIGLGISYGLSSRQLEGNVISCQPSSTDLDVDLTKNTRALLVSIGESRSLDSKGTIEM
jgi:hypothetical protein